MSTLTNQLIEYGNSVINGGKDNPPPLDLQVSMKNMNIVEFIKLEKSNIEYKQLKHYKDNLTTIPVDLKAYSSNETDFILLTAIYTLKFLGGYYTQQIELLIKLLAKPFDVKEQMYRTEAKM